MAFFTLRFDLRNPSFAGISTADRYGAALDMCEWAESNGFIMVVLSEHHGSPDGYLPSAVPFAAAVAARTRQVRIMISAVVASFHDPLKLAEDIAVVDAISGGRLDLVVTNGYVAEEFAMFDRPLNKRVASTVETVETLQGAFSGEPFEFRGRTVQVTPAPHTPGGPPLLLGGSTPPAARRAARLGLGFLPAGPEVWQVYREACAEYERPDPGPWLGGDTSFIHVAKDVERGWQQIGPHAMHEANSYGHWMADAGIGGAGGYVPFASLDELRATGQYRVLTPEQLVDELRAAGPFASAMMHPMMGGIPPEVAWESLRLVETEVIPALAE